MSEYVIKKGDTLSKIVMNTYGVKGADVQKYYMEIAKINGIKDPNLIFAGAKLKLPEDMFQSTTQPAQPAANEQPAAAQQAPQPEVQPAQLQTRVQTASFSLTGDNNTQQAEPTPSSKRFAFNPETIANFMGWQKEFQTLEQQYNEKFDEINQNALAHETTWQELDDAFAELDREYASAYNAINNKFNFNQDDMSYEQSLKNLAMGTVKSFGEKDGLSFEGFLNWYTGMLTAKQLESFNEEQFRQTFDKLDGNNDLRLDENELSHMYRVIDGMDKKEDGNIDIEVLKDSQNTFHPNMY